MLFPTIVRRWRQRDLLIALVLAGCALIAIERPAAAQQAGTRLSAEQRGIGRIEVRVQKYDQALGVVTRLLRSPEAETECQGACFLPSSSHSVSWRCAPNNGCELHCDVNPPVGGCR